MSTSFARSWTNCSRSQHLAALRCAGRFGHRNRRGRGARYSYGESKRLFTGFSLEATGTVSGLNVYPPRRNVRSEWRDVTGDLAYRLYKRLDARLLQENRDLLGRHWAILAHRGGGTSVRRTVRGEPLNESSTTQLTPYDAVYMSYEGRRRAGCPALRRPVRLRNSGRENVDTRRSASHERGFRWLDRNGVRVAARRSAAAWARAVATIRKRSSCR